MKRRKFLIASGSTFLARKSILNTQKPAFAVDYKLTGIPEENPDNIESISISFDKLEITPYYLNSSNDTTVSTSIELDGYEKSQNKSIVRTMENGSSYELSNSTILGDLNVSDLSIQNESSLLGFVTISINHPDITESYTDQFVITSAPLPDEVEYHWSHNDRMGTTLSEDINGLDASINGAEWKQTTNGKYYLEYDGTDSAPISGSRDTLNFILSGVCTIVGWIRPDNLSEFGTITGVYQTSNGETYKLDVSNERGIQFYVSGKEEDVNDKMVSVTTGGSSVTNGAWIPFCAKMDGTNATIYIGRDLELQDTSSIDQSHKRDRVFTSNISSNYDVTFGRRGDGKLPFEGGIGDYWKSSQNIPIEDVRNWVDATKSNYPV